MLTIKLYKQTARYKYLINKVAAQRLVFDRLTYFNNFYNFKYSRVSIKNQATRWGSCSRQGNLNFNYKIVLLPPDLADYIIVHELCHLGQLNHGPKFWQLVNLTVPDYKLRRHRLRAITLHLT